MAQLVVRDLESDVKARLKRRAVQHGRSLEAEVRDILRNAVKEDDRRGGGLGTRIAVRFARLHLREDELPELPRQTIEPPSPGE